MLYDAIDECAAKTASALKSLSTNYDPPPVLRLRVLSLVVVTYNEVRERDRYEMGFSAV
jgi:hypothetical protein